MRLRTAVIILLVVPLACYFAVLAGGGEWIVPATLAVCITVPTAVATLIGVVKVSTARPTFGPVVALSATFVRMVWAVLVVAILNDRAADLGTTSTAVAQWTTAFYLLTLLVETVLLWRLLNVADGPRGTGAPADGKPAEPIE